MTKLEELIAERNRIGKEIINECKKCQSQETTNVPCSEEYYEGNYYDELEEAVQCVEIHDARYTPRSNSSNNLRTRPKRHHHPRRYEDELWDDGRSFGNISINVSPTITVSVDNSVTTTTTSTKTTHVDTNLTTGDSALGMLGGIFGKIFN